MTEPNRISAIITCFNASAFVADAIASVRRQKIPVDEIVIIDDGSTDDTNEVISSLAGKDLVYHAQSNTGLPGARNAGLEQASGNIITFLDYDDVWTDDKLKIQVPMLGEDPRPDLVVGYAQMMQMAKKPGGEMTFIPHEKPIPALSMNGAVIRREVFDRVGLFDPSQKFCDDWDWYMRVREQGLRLKMHDDVVHYYRRHDRNMTNDVELGNQQTLMMLKKSLERRRAQHGKARSLPGLLKEDD